MSTAPIAFTGLSTFSTDFQAILQRSVGISQLPLKALQNSQANVALQKQALITLNTSVADIGASITALASLANSKGLAASSSDSTLVTVSNTGAASPGSYTISNIQSLAAAASETSASGYASSTTGAVSTAGNLKVVIGTNTYPISLGVGKNNLVGLRDAINKLGVGVSASILTTGTGTTPNYLSVQSTSSGETTLRLNDVAAGGAETNLLTAANQGSNAVFQLNGKNVSRTSNNVNDVVAGITFNLLAKPATADGTVTLSLASDNTQFSGALRTFVARYNALVDQVATQVGQAAGPLSGDFIIRQVESDLRQTTSYYQTSGTIRGLANLGVTLDATGQMSFDQTTFNSLSAAQITDGFSFMGSATTGFGALAKKFTELSDPSTGMIRLQEDGYDRTTKTLADRIARVTEQVSSLQSSMTLKLQAADAALAMLQSQQQLITSSIQSINLGLYGKNTG